MCVDLNRPRQAPRAPSGQRHNEALEQRTMTSTSHLQQQQQQQHIKQAVV
jgi:hypothetical protein